MKPLKSQSKRRLRRGLYTLISRQGLADPKHWEHDGSGNEPHRLLAGLYHTATCCHVPRAMARQGPHLAQRASRIVSAFSAHL